VIPRLKPVMVAHWWLGSCLYLTSPGNADEYSNKCILRRPSSWKRKNWSRNDFQS
jgi:hypothetical protein